MLILCADKWILPEVIGEAPPPLLYFSLSSIGNNKAALFGGKNNSCSFNDIMIVEFELTINDQLQVSYMCFPLSVAFHLFCTRV